MSGYAKFTHEENVERRVQCTGNLVGDWYAAARQRKNKQVVASGVPGDKRGGKRPPGEDVATA